MDEKHPDSDIIDAFGGTGEVARICDVKQPSVSKWRHQGIPPARRMYLRLIRPDLFPAAAPPELAEHQEGGHA